MGGVVQRESDGRKYVEFEFASKASNYIRHALASVTIANGAHPVHSHKMNDCGISCEI
jgi:hypothetical protein